MHSFNLDQLGVFVQGGILTTLLAFSGKKYNSLNLYTKKKGKTSIEVSACINSSVKQSYTFSLTDSTESILRNTLSFSEEIDNNYTNWEEEEAEIEHLEIKATKKGLVNYLQNQRNFLHPY